MPGSGPRSLRASRRRDRCGSCCARCDVVPFVVLIGGTLGKHLLGLVDADRGRGGRLRAGDDHLRVLGRLQPADLRGTPCRPRCGSCGNILFIVYAAFLFSYAISYAGVGETDHAVSGRSEAVKLEFFFALFVLYTVLGCLVESLGMIVVTVPLLYPVLLQYGIDPIWFGVILVLFIEMGQISPPIGINLFVIQSIWTGKLSDVVQGHDSVSSDHVRRCSACWWSSPRSRCGCRRKRCRRSIGDSSDVCSTPADQNRSLRPAAG